MIMVPTVRQIFYALISKIATIEDPSENIFKIEGWGTTWSDFVLHQKGIENSVYNTTRKWVRKTRNNKITGWLTKHSNRNAKSLR